MHVCWWLGQSHSPAPLAGPHVLAHEVGAPGSTNQNFSWLPLALRVGVQVLFLLLVCHAGPHRSGFRNVSGLVSIHGGRSRFIEETILVSALMQSNVCAYPYLQPCGPFSFNNPYIKKKHKLFMTLREHKVRQCSSTIFSAGNYSFRSTSYCKSMGTGELLNQYKCGVAPWHTEPLLCSPGEWLGGNELLHPCSTESTLTCSHCWPGGRD